MLTLDNPPETELRLDNRIKAIINEVDSVSTLVDVGCDHGKVAVGVILSNKAKKVIAIDISEQSLNKTISLAKKYNLADKIICIKSDGLTAITQRPDSIIIAGLGGIEITRILSQNIIDTKYIIVPHQDSAVLREYLMLNNFHINKDYIISSNKMFYDIIVTQRSLSPSTHEPHQMPQPPSTYEPHQMPTPPSTYQPHQLYIGKNTPPSKHFQKKLELRKKVIQSIMDKVDDPKRLSSTIKQEWEEINNALQNMPSNKDN